MPLRRVSSPLLADMMISDLFTCSNRPSLQCTVCDEWAFEGLGLQLVALMMSSNWNIEDVIAKYSSADGD